MQVTCIPYFPDVDLIKTLNFRILLDKPLRCHSCIAVFSPYRKLVGSEFIVLTAVYYSMFVYKQCWAWFVDVLECRSFLFTALKESLSSDSNILPDLWPKVTRLTV